LHGEEVGVHGSLAGQLTYDVALFHLLTANDFGRYRLESRPLEPFYDNAGSSRRYGAATALGFFPSPRLSMELAYTYSRFRYDQVRFNDATYYGAWLPNSPQHQAAPDAEYRVTSDFMIGAGAGLQSRAYIDPPDTTWIGGYTLISARVSYRTRLAGTAAEFLLSGRNLGGKWPSPERRTASERELGCRDEATAKKTPTGTMGRKVIGMDGKELLWQLNAAYASEWRAYHQYWLGANVIKGPMKDSVVAELTLHATEELNHATLLAERIIQLGDTPITAPRKWFDLSPCAYDAPDDPYVAVLLDQNIVGKRCAIDTYRKLTEATNDRDIVTYNIALTILDQEVEHEEALQNLKKDLDLMVFHGNT
jgi:bacterioferritin